MSDTDHQRHLRRGFNWLGGATVLAKVIDFTTILAVLGFLSKQQVGVASLVISAGMVIEAFDGLGTGDALLQAPSVSKRQLDSLFWFIMAAALVMGALTLLAAPGFELLYGVPGMAAYFIAVGAKQPLVAAAVIPLALLNRDLRYERIAMVNVAATLGAALTRLGLAMAGAGAWALVAGYVASGLYTLVGATLARPFRPGLHFQRDDIGGLVRFGFRAAAVNLFEQIFKNIDFLLVGWFYGAAPLALYRVAFDIAMEPVMAVGTLINRTALPVFARMAGNLDGLTQSLTWSLRRLALLTAPLMVGLILAADSLTALIHDDNGASYAAAALPLKLLAGAALLRVTAQLLTPLMMASGRPGLAARLSATSLALLSAGIVGVGLLLPAAMGIVAVSAVWLALYPPVLLWGAHYLRGTWGIAAGTVARAFALPVAGIVVMATLVWLLRLLPGSERPAAGVAIVVAAMAAVYGGLFRYDREKPVN
ncbi:oligosaccharide flippase family protein [Nitrospirillum pindoramense]|uniref:O-antigen/teichoic acid export membrane protein n=1 Tax=Nitrospirillum amazonense TaxID=28077 RepID=A0A560H4B0_9PROT|nr:oligosaccharide flippase family protein [Nitrospirillum amazonense]TWB41127.1 O-antigen/teichoic acid export membrane protein [Nitrospirillum amazonense]